MAWLLVLNIEGDPSDDTTVEVQRFKRGDVLDVFPNSWKPARMEKDNPRFRIIKVPGGVKAYEDLVETDLPFSSDAVIYPARKRRLDLDSVEKAAGIAKRKDKDAGEILDVPTEQVTRMRAALRPAESVKSDVVIE